MEDLEAKVAELEAELKDRDDQISLLEEHLAEIDEAARQLYRLI